MLANPPDFLSTEQTDSRGEYPNSLLPYKLVLTVIAINITWKSLLVCVYFPQDPKIINITESTAGSSNLQLAVRLWMMSNESIFPLSIHTVANTAACSLAEQFW